VKWTKLEEVLSVPRKVGNLCFAYREMTDGRVEEYKMMTERTISHVMSCNAPILRVISPRTNSDYVKSTTHAFNYMHDRHPCRVDY